MSKADIRSLAFRLAVVAAAAGGGLVVTSWFVPGAARRSSWIATVCMLVAVAAATVMPERVRNRLNEPIRNDHWFAVAVVLFVVLMVTAAMAALTGATG